MIVSVLYYALYPLSRYLTSRHSEASKKGLPPAVVNGKTVWHGGAVTTRSFTESQKTLLDQWLSPSSETKGETKERMKEPSPEKEDEIRPDKKQLMAVLHEETKNEDASKMSEVKSALKEKEAETRNEQQQDEVEASTQVDREISKKEDNEISKKEGREISKQEHREITIHHEVFHMKQNTEDGSIFPTEDISPEQDLGAPLECLQAEDSTKETTRSVQEKMKIPSLEESVTPAVPSIQDTTHPVQEQILIHHLEESMAPAKTTAEVTECWDEYLAPTADGGESSSLLLLSSLLSNTQTLLLSGQHDTPTSWHFPAGPGLAEEVQCPLWQFPALSYYPPIEPIVPFEVMWRVWEDVDESATAAEPFPFTKASMDFTVMSYNILAEDLLEANQELYTHCPLEVLDWSYRCSLLLEEIKKWEPDILCLQEVQENHYHEQLYPVLSQMGYTCVYKQRTGTKTDGCATCYRSSCFFEVSVTSLEFFRPETELLDRHNVGIVLLLRPVVIQGSEVKAKGPPLCVANTHLLFNPSRGDVKLAQLAIMLAEIDSVVKSCKAKGKHCNLILCGDFNSLPHTPLYQLITTGELYFQGLPAWMISGQEDQSHKAYCHRLFAPLWPSSLGITDSCQYTTVKEALKSQNQKSGFPVHKNGTDRRTTRKHSKCLMAFYIQEVKGKGQYSHEFMLQMRFCPAACVRPLDLEQIPGVTDNMPDASRGSQSHDNRFRHTISHRLELKSVYKHILPGFGHPEVTTLHSEAGATVDYIFYSPRRVLHRDLNAGDLVSEGLKLIGSLSLLSEDVLWSMKGLPNHIFPSDHLSLLAKFQLDLNSA
ncbi:protein angel homolog 1 isoform X3 [Perca fluviatilis]|uniref:protein angel homolog 1 isoform X2 n=1 Tax=Perca fluviatilis TaxID=8168 RepID=UPI0019622C9E|nr:protein angel homolog 1 isoform X2 [Perca fluviatilis]XP_039642864.1 protein angel homolog 1 isoform X3 [Perca fluviatilis]